VEAAVSNAAIWCIDRQYLDRLNFRHPANESIDDANRRYIALVEDIISGGGSTAGIIHVEPDRLNERMAIQKGVFVFPKDVSQSFMTNLAAVTTSDIGERHLDTAHRLSYDQFTRVLNTPAAPIVAKLILPKWLHNYGIHQLASMNIDPTSLFPGLDGFARLLNRLLRMPSRASIRAR